MDHERPIDCFKRPPFEDYSHSSSLATTSSSNCGTGGSHAAPADLSGSPRLREAAHHYAVLLGEYDSGTLSYACLRLAEIIMQGDSECLQYLFDKDVVGMISKIMEDLPSHSVVQQAGCEALLRCNEQVQLRGLVEDHQVYTCILAAMKNHSNATYVLGKAVYTLVSLATTSVNDAGLKNSRAYSFLLMALKKHPQNVTIQSGGLLALAHVLKTDMYAISNIILQGEHEIILDALKNHLKIPLVVAHSCMALQTLAKCEEERMVLIDSEALSLGVEALEGFEENEVVVCAACGLVDSLTASVAHAYPSEMPPSSFVHQINHLKLVDHLVTLLDKYTGVLEVQVYTLSALAHVCLLPGVQVKDFRMDHCLTLISDAMVNHPEAELQEAACRCLARLLGVNPYLHSLIGNDTKKYQIPLQNKVWFTLLTLLSHSNGTDPALFQAVTLAIYYLVADDESLQQLLLDKGAAPAVLEGMREFLQEPMKNERCVEYGCMALNGLIMHNCSDNQKNHLIEVCIVSELVRILDDFLHDPEVVSEAFGVIACLADLEAFYKSTGSDSIHKQVLQAVEKHHGHPVLVESALEVLIILSLSDGMMGILNEADTLGATISIMKTHIVSSSIQRKGCLLIRLLCDEDILALKPLCTSVANVVINALTRWRTDPDVHIEALACTQKLCETSSLMAEALVKGDVHLLLFNMLSQSGGGIESSVSVGGEEGDDGGCKGLMCGMGELDCKCERVLEASSSGRPLILILMLHYKGILGTKLVIFEVGTDIIYNLSCVRDFKQEMLTTAIRDGFLEAVKVLVDIGADVTAGTNTNTPICLAVQSQRKDMVEYLLEQGVNNVHDALTIAQNLKLNDIIGLLLQSIALDRNGDVVNLSGLELQTLKPQWILPSLGIKDSYSRKMKNSILGQELQRRKSLSCIGDKESLEALNRNMELRTSGTDEPDSGVVTSVSNQYLLEDDTPIRKPSSSSHGSSTGTSRKGSAGSLKLVGVETSSSTGISVTPPPIAWETRSGGGVSSEELSERLVALAAKNITPGRITKRKQGVAAVPFEPSLSPIKGTPNQTLKRQLLFQEQKDSGIENEAGAGIQSPSKKRMDSVESSESSESHSSVTPRRQGQAKKTIITGARKLPFSTAGEYNKQRSADELESPTDVSVGEFSISPKLIQRRMSAIWRKNHRRKSSVISEAASRADSPIPMLYGRTDYYDSRGSTPVCFSPVTSPRSSVADDDIVPTNWTTPEGKVRSSSSESSRITTPSSASRRSSIIDIRRRRSSIDIGCIQRERETYEETDFDVIPEEGEPQVIMTTPNLVKVLDISANQLRGLEQLVDGGNVVFRRMKGLHRLDLKQNNLKQLPEELMQEMKQLSIINLSCNSFRQFPVEAVKSQALTELDLAANQICHVPHFPSLPNLTKLNLNSNHLEEFPTAFNGDALPRLRILNLKSNQISRIPNSDSRLRNLEQLNISNNQVVELPDQFLAGLQALETLDASRNELVSIPGEVATDLVQLKTLKVCHNKLGKAEAEFNKFITSAPVIQTVDAADNGLSTLPPPYAWESRGVKDLWMSGNRISRVDFSEGGRYWPNIEGIYLSQNKLKEIPKEVGQLLMLGCLDISHNREIRSLPDEMGNLEHLFMLNLQGLKNLSLDPSLQNGPTKAIVNFLRSRHHKSVPYYHMKMMIVGGPGKGKTTLLHQLIQAKISHRGNIATLGVNVKEWSYLQRPGVTYYISCWDFAGQEEFYSTHQCFLTCRSLYVVVYNLSQGVSELQNLLSWLLNIQAIAPRSPIIIVGTHKDKIPEEEYMDRKREIRTKIMEMLRKPGFPSDVCFADISCFNEKLISGLRRKIKEVIDSAKLRGQKIMGGPVPANYLALEELIQKETKRLLKEKSRFPVLRASRLRELMEESKLSQKMDKAELDQAIRFLHECGVLLHYNDIQTKLSELFFLDPEWLCMLMAHIITVQEMNPFINSQGLLNVKSIPLLLKEPRFPSEFKQEYIRLLERFEVALRQTPDTLLIPSFLPKKKPDAIVLPPATPGSQIIRRYSICYIPPGFWPRLVSRLIAFPKRVLNQSSEPTLKVWSGGIYSFWSEQAFFLVELQAEKSNTFDIIVPTTKLGTQLLCKVVDNIEILIDEWFPGLRDVDVTCGVELVIPMSLCPLCPISLEPHCFMLKDLQQMALTSDEVICPQHHGIVILEHLAPDIVISDLEPKYKLSPDAFSLIESSSNILGKGGFGEVYKAMFKGEAVAVKVFSQKAAEINNTTPSHLLRQEVSILSQLKHPNIISMVGVCLRPKPMLLLEYAELSSLHSLYPYSGISLPLKHRIVLQVASALAYLHKNSIIYRDLKAENILIFSFSLITTAVNAKLSDYGIACFATELMQSMGTTGCKAPEVLKSDTTYTDKVDMYSYGLLLYVLMTNGHKPFEELGTGYAMDTAIKTGRPINDIEHYGCPPWPDMQDLIRHCLQKFPNDRPSAQEVFDRLCSAEFVSLKRAIPIEHDRTVETFTIRNYMDKRRTVKVEVWMASTIGTQSMLSTINLSERTASLQGMMTMPNVEVICMVAVDSSLVLVGTNTGIVQVYDGYERKPKHQLAPLKDSVLCLVHFKSHTEGAYYVCAGLANGQLAFYDQYMLTIPHAQAKTLDLGMGPIRSIKRFRSRLYVCCGSDVVVVKIANLSVERRWRAIEDSHGYLTCVVVGLEMVWTAHSRSSRIQLWDIEDGRFRGSLPCDVIMNSMLPKERQVDSYNARVTSMLLQPLPYSVLWVGLGNGHLLLINAATRTPLMVTSRHINAVRCICTVKALITDKPVHLVLTGGFGFQQRPGYEAPKKGTPETYGSMLVWDSIMPRVKVTYDDIKKQQEPFR